MIENSLIELDVETNLKGTLIIKCETTKQPWTPMMCSGLFLNIGIIVDKTVLLHMEFATLLKQSTSPQKSKNIIVYNKVKSFSREISRKEMRNMKNVKEDTYTPKKFLVVSNKRTKFRMQRHHQAETQSYFPQEIDGTASLVNLSSVY